MMRSEIKRKWLTLMKGEVLRYEMGGNGRFGDDGNRDEKCVV